MCEKYIKLLIASLLVVFAGTVVAVDAQAEKIRGAVLKIGTVNWELQTIKKNKLDTANGYQLDVIPFADNGATRIALQADGADFAVADWIWVARQNAEGKDYVFLPYSRSVGGVVVAADSGIQSLVDLKGKKIGIAGGPVDKSWLILRAYAQQEYGMNLAEETEQVFGAPPLIMKSGFSGETNATINFWHFMAKMKSAGMREIITVAKAAEKLGLNPSTPLLGYVFKRSFVETHRDLVAGFAASSRAAKNLLNNDRAAWNDIRPIMRVKNDAQYEALIEGFRQGIPPDQPVDVEAAAKMLRVMAALGGKKLVGKASELPKDIFLSFP